MPRGTWAWLLWVKGERDEAIFHFAEVFRIRPDVEARDNLQARNVGQHERPV
jgi:hypothetical protein